MTSIDDNYDAPDELPYDSSEGGYQWIWGGPHDAEEALQDGEAIASLERQARIHEVKGNKDRIEAIAKEYARSPESTLVVSPDNRSRMEINQAIHAELQSKGIVGQEEHRTQLLVPRQDLTGADRIWAARYDAGDVLLCSRSSQETGIAKGECARVESVDAPNNQLTVELQDGTEKSYDPRRQQGVSIYASRTESSPSETGCS